MDVEVLVKKINKEYELFYLDTIKNSRENIYAKSGEIERKKYLAMYLKKFVRRVNGIKRDELMVANNLIDECYRYILDHEELGFDEALEEYMERYEM